MVFITDILNEQNDHIRLLAVDSSSTTLAITKDDGLIHFYSVSEIINRLSEYRESLISDPEGGCFRLPSSIEKCEINESSSYLVKMCFSPKVLDFKQKKSFEIKPGSEEKTSTTTPGVFFKSANKNTKITLKEFLPAADMQYSGHVLSVGYDSGKILLITKEVKSNVWKIATSFVSQVSEDDLMIDFAWSHDGKFIGQLLYDFSVMIWEVDVSKGNIQMTKRHLINFTIFELISQSGSLKSNLCPHPREYIFYIFFSNNCYSIKFNQAMFSIDLLEMAPATDNLKEDKVKMSEKPAHELNEIANQEKKDWELLREHMEEQFFKPILDHEGKFIFFPKYDRSGCLTVHRLHSKGRMNSKYALKTETNVRSLLETKFSYVWLPPPYDTKEFYTKKKIKNIDEILKDIHNSNTTEHSFLLTIKKQEVGLWILDSFECDSCPLEKHLIIEKLPFSVSLAMWLDQYNLILCGELGELIILSFDIIDLGAVTKGKASGALK